MLVKRSGKLCVFVISWFILFLALFCVTGCLERADGPIQEPSPALSSQSIASELQMECDVELESDLFRLQGDLLFPGVGSLAYILLNASLGQGGKTILTTKYLLMQIEPNREYGFEICKSCRLSAGEYDCVLRAEGPQGIIAEESRRIDLAQSRIRPGGWSEAEEAAFWQMIEENEREEDEREVDEVKEDEGGEDGGKEERREDPSHSLEESKVFYSGDQAGDGRDEALFEEDALLVGSITSRKYHRQDCRYAQKIKRENLVRFEGVEDARAQGYQPCKVCNP